jgi:hypothetical protein
MQAVPINTDVSSNLDQDKVYNEEKGRRGGWKKG